MQKKCILSEENALLVCDDLNNFKVYEDNLFQIYMALYEKGKIIYDGLPVVMKHYPPDYGERSGFYHLICENYQHTMCEDDRAPNFRRCERLKWPEIFLSACSENCSKLLVWENVRHGKSNVILFCPQLNYVVVLGKRKGYFLLTTAYPVTYPNRKRDLMREYDRYKQTTHSA